MTPTPPSERQRRRRLRGLAVSVVISEPMAAAELRRLSRDGMGPTRALTLLLLDSASRAARRRRVRPD